MLGISHQHAPPDKRKSNGVVFARTCDESGALHDGSRRRAAGGAKYQISGTKNQSLTGYPGDFRFMTRMKIKLASQISQW
jgi:hypothetical protein